MKIPFHALVTFFASVLVATGAATAQATSTHASTAPVRPASTRTASARPARLGGDGLHSTESFTLNEVNNIQTISDNFFTSGWHDFVRACEIPAGAKRETILKILGSERYSSSVEDVQTACGARADHDYSSFADVHQFTLDVKLDGPCLDASGQPHDATTALRRGAPICVSIPRLMRYPQSALRVELFGLIIHQLVLQLTASQPDERMATELQYYFKRKLQWLPTEHLLTGSGEFLEMTSNERLLPELANNPVQQSTRLLWACSHLSVVIGNLMQSPFTTHFVPQTMSDDEFLYAYPRALFANNELYLRNDRGFPSYEAFIDDITGSNYGLFFDAESVCSGYGHQDAFMRLHQLHQLGLYFERTLTSQTDGVPFAQAYPHN